MGWRFWRSEGRSQQTEAERSLAALQQPLDTRAAGDLSVDLSPPAAPSTDSDRSSGFRMTIEDVFSITGRGTVVTGTVEGGRVDTGQQVMLASAAHGQRVLTVSGIEMFRKVAQAAEPGESVGLLLRGLRRDRVDRGDVLYG